MAAQSILVVDDEASIRRTLREILEYEGLKVDEARDGVEALRKVRAHSYDVALLDIKMPRKDGLETLAELVERWPELPVIMISGHADVKTAVEATRTGAFHFIEKPPDLHQLLVTIRSALVRGRLVLENRRMRQTITQRREDELTPILGSSTAIGRIKQIIERVAPTEARVLITGEAGTGKELVAKWIHHLSPRRKGPLVAVNCAAIPAELIESELFGHEKGSFTGAIKQRIGKFEQANGGTLFLDEVGDMSLSAQAKVLRALQESVIMRVGGDRPIKVDVRVVAATNKALRECIEEGTFREDLYHRLSVILAQLPPVRERRGDLPVLLKHFLTHLARRNGLPSKEVSPGAMRRLSKLPWRGNVREIHNVAERLLILGSAAEITAQDVETYVHAGPIRGDRLHRLTHECDNLGEFRSQAEKLFLVHKLRENDWNISRTAERVGIQRSNLYSRIRRLGIERDSTD